MEWIIGHWEVTGLAIGAMDIVLGGLPDRITKYPGMILKICHELYGYGKESGMSKVEDMK